MKLRFPFPFYGHRLRNITIATGGFLYVGEYTHSWLAATQYIAPLMGNFETLSPEAFSLHSAIFYGDDGKKMIIEWRSLALKNNSSAGDFTFQVHLFRSGDIWFVYDHVGFFITSTTSILIADRLAHGRYQSLPRTVTANIP